MAPRSFLVACLWLSALPALGQGVRFVQPLAGTTLTVGDEVVVRWSGTPADAEEMELLLSVDGSRRFAVRLTHEMEGDATTYLWRVPRLPTGAARLALRANLDGREVEVGESAPFAIAARPSSNEADGPAGSIQFLRGELWWLECGVAGSEGDRLALAGLDPLPPEPRFLPAAGESMLADLRSPTGAPQPALCFTSFPILLSASCRPASARPIPRAPLGSPLRI